jgi:hypothetical protein
MKCLEVPLTKGKMIYIPAYWWYSIKFTSENSSISCFRYRTYINNLAISPYISMHMLQIQNIKRDVAKKISVDVLKNKVNDNLNDPHITVNNSNNESINEISIQTTTSINDLENDNNNNKSEAKEDPKPIMEYENFGADIN